MLFYLFLHIFPSFDISKPAAFFNDCGKDFPLALVARPLFYTIVPGDKTFSAQAKGFRHSYLLCVVCRVVLLVVSFIITGPGDGFITALFQAGFLFGDMEAKQFIYCSQIPA